MNVTTLTLLVATPLALVALRPAPAPPEPWHAPDPRLDLVSRGSGTWSLRADSVPVGRVLAEIADRTGLVFDAADVPLDLPVTIRLEERPLDTVLEVTLGSAGLALDRDGTPVASARSRTLRLRRDRLPAERDAALAVASDAWERTRERAASAPDPVARAVQAEARLAQGDLAAQRGDVHRAEALYADAVRTAAPASAAGDEARLSAGRLLEGCGSWSRALEAYGSISAAAPSRRRHASVGAARCELALGRPGEALERLDALEHEDAGVRSSREAELVRAEALLELGRGAEALAWLEATPSGGDAWRLRATALEALGREPEAAQAWLRRSRASAGPRAEAAGRRAAELALADGDALGALFALRAAPPDARDAELEDAARARCGLAPAPAPADAPADAAALRERALALEAQGRFDEARDAAARAAELCREPELAHVLAEDLAFLRWRAAAGSRLVERARAAEEARR